MKEWDEQSEQSQSQVNALDGISGQNQQHQRPLLPSSSPPLRGEQQEQQQPKVQLDSVENELILPDKLLYLAKVSSNLTSSLSLSPRRLVAWLAGRSCFACISR